MSVLHLNSIVANAADSEVAEALHRLEHRNGVEWILLDAADTARKRLRVATDKGTDCAIAISRTERLENGSVLELGDERAIVVRMKETEWLVLAARDEAAALELGYFVGNLHWRVRFDGARILVALDGPRQTYLDRIAEHLADGRARLLDSDT